MSNYREQGERQDHRIPFNIKPDQPLVPQIYQFVDSRRLYPNATQSRLILAALFLSPEQRAKEEIGVYKAELPPQFAKYYPLEIQPMKIILALPGRQKKHFNDSFILQGTIFEVASSLHPDKELLELADIKKARQIIKSANAIGLHHVGFDYEMQIELLKTLDKQIKHQHFELKDGAAIDPKKVYARRDTRPERLRGTETEHLNRLKTRALKNLLEFCVKLEEDYPNFGDIYNYSRQTNYKDFFHFVFMFNHLKVNFTEIHRLIINRSSKDLSSSMYLDNDIAETTINYDRLKSIVKQLQHKGETNSPEKWVLDFINSLYPDGKPF